MWGRQNQTCPPKGLWSWALRPLQHCWDVPRGEQPEGWEGERVGEEGGDGNGEATKGKELLKS